MNITPMLRKQIEADITSCDLHTEINGSERLYSELVARYIVLDPKFKDSLSTNGKAAAVGAEFDYRPELHAIASKLKMYLLMEESDGVLSSPLKEQVDEFISRGERIGREEYHPAQNGFPISYISGPQYDKWMSEINIFSERHLKTHPLYDSLHVAFSHRNTRPSAYEDMMSYLNALAADKEFWEGNVPKENKMMYDVFISHASADKIEYVDQLKKSLDKLRISVFYDKDSIEWGDKWKEKILEGVDQAEFAIIIISENFFGREWTEKELQEFLNRQNSNGQKIILPILHKITSSQLKEKYPDVADIQALNSSDYSCDEIALMFAGQLIKRLKA